MHFEGQQGRYITEVQRYGSQQDVTQLKYVCLCMIIGVCVLGFCSLLVSMPSRVTYGPACTSTLGEGEHSSAR